MGTLGHVFEKHGLATVTLALIRGQIETVAPPRALYVEFPLGRPLGRPRDPSFQRSVIDAAFALLERTDGPVLEDFPETIDDEVEEPVVCNLPPRHDPDVHPAVDEARGLRPAWERSREANGGTQVGRVISGEDVPDALAGFIEVVEGAPWNEVDFVGDPTTVLMDIRAYYEEAAMAMVDHVPAARAAETWYYQATETGTLVRAFLAAVKDADPPFEAWGYVVPMSQM